MNDDAHGDMDDGMNQDGPTVRVTRTIAAAPERVYDAWLDPDTARCWLFATPEGTMERVEIDARVGGTFCVVERRPRGVAEHYGAYMALERPHRIAFAFGTEPDGSDASPVTVDIVPTEEGCEITITHEMRPEWAAYKEKTEQGWSMILTGLERVLGGDKQD